MKIAFITTGAYMEQEDYAKGNLLGTENQVWGLSKELAKKENDVYIFRRWFESKKEVIENINVLSFKSVNSKSGLKMTFYKLKFSREISKVLKNSNFDILILIDPFTSYFALKLPVHKICVIHNEIPRKLLDEINEYSKITKIKNKLLRMMQKKLFENSDMLVSPNTTIKNYLENEGYKSKFIPNGIEIENYITDISDENYILFGGRFVKSKKIEDLIKAYSKLNEELKNKYKLKIMGFGPEKSQLINLVKGYGLENRIEFVSWASSKDFIKKISKCSVFVLPSLYETFGIVIIEAMALSKPVISSDTFGAFDIIKNEYNGFIFEKENVIQLHKVLETTLENINLRNEIGTNAQKTVQKCFTFNKIADDYIKLFNEICANNV